MSETIYIVADTIGIIGVVFVLLAFYLLTVHRLQVLDVSYQVLNFFGAIMILFSLLFFWNTASVIVETAWALISLVGIYRAVRAKR